jgi:hypothetical protein
MSERKRDQLAFLINEIEVLQHSGDSDPPCNEPRPA